MPTRRSQGLSICVVAWNGSRRRLCRRPRTGRCGERLRSCGNHVVDVSIILLTKNGQRYLEGVLGAVFAQQTEHGYEVIAIDSGSSDGTVELLRRYPVALRRIPPEQFNHGATRNLGASL